jgi:hypothetical protein
MLVGLSTMLHGPALYLFIYLLSVFEEFDQSLAHVLLFGYVGNQPLSLKLLVLSASTSQPLFMDLATVCSQAGRPRILL